ncbi:hypothetical protein BDD12DRAFT_271793 [Trichophaea hybrida]|nr:hypothetical protein BDD12DRAFT_271793 [Trichophaea hybrida]
MGEDPSPTAARSLLREPADRCDSNMLPAPPTLPHSAEPSSDKLHVTVATPSSVLEGEETPEIAPTTDHSETIQNDASPAQPRTESNTIESQEEIQERIARRDSVLTPDQEPSLTVRAVPTSTASNENRVQIVEACAEKSEQVVEASDMPETVDTAATPSAVQDTRHTTSPIAADARSITAKSIGDRSLVASSVISPEDEVLSLRVRSLYDSGLGGVGSDVSSQFSADIAQRRISSIIEEGAIGVSRLRGTRSSFPGASKEVARRSQLGGSVEGRISCELLLGRSDGVIDLRICATLEAVKADSKRSSLAGGVEDWDDLEGHDVDRYLQCLFQGSPASQ